MDPVTVELCAGAGGQAIGLEVAGFEHSALFENDKAACATLRTNRPHWNVLEHDLFQSYDWCKFKDIDLLAGGLPCPPFSVAGKQLGEGDERNLFNVGIELVDELQLTAVMFENVKGLLEPRFKIYRERSTRAEEAWLQADWNLLQSSDFGVPQLRPRVLLVAVRNFAADRFEWPSEKDKSAKTVGETLALMAKNGWPHAKAWKEACQPHRTDHHGRLQKAWRARPRPHSRTEGLGRTGGERHRHRRQQRKSRTPRPRTRWPASRSPGAMATAAG